MCVLFCVIWKANSHERYARAFVQQRVREVFEILDSKVCGWPPTTCGASIHRDVSLTTVAGQGDGQLDEEELLSHLWSVGYQATKVPPPCWRLGSGWRHMSCGRLPRP